MLSRTSLTASTASLPLATASRPLVWASDTTLRSWLRVAIAPVLSDGCAFPFQPEPNKKVPGATASLSSRRPEALPSSASGASREGRVTPLRRATHECRRPPQGEFGDRGGGQAGLYGG